MFKFVLGEGGKQIGSNIHKIIRRNVEVNSQYRIEISLSSLAFAIAIANETTMKKVEELM